MNIDHKKIRLATGIKWAIGLAAAAVIAPVIFYAVQGLVGLALAIIVGLAITNGAPYLSMVLANWKLKGLKHEAATNPIETLENLLIAKRQAIDEFEVEVTKAAAARSTFERQVQDFTRKYPARAKEFAQKLDAMGGLVSQKKDALKDAKAALSEGQDKLAEMKAYWDMSLAAQAANKAAGLSTGDLYEQLKADTAVDAVMLSMDTAFAQMEVAASLVETPALTHQPVDTIDINSVSVRERVRA